MVHRLFPVVACLFVAAATLPAQITAAVGSSQSLMRLQTNDPVSMVFEHKNVQTLPDGTHIAVTTQERFYRDSLGRTRSDSQVGSMSTGSSSEPESFVNVNDPVAGTHLSWLTGPARMPRTYSRWTIPTASTAPPPLPSRRAATPPNPMMERQRAPKSPQPQVKQEPLGTQLVQGEPCELTRQTAVFPEGFFGNDQPVTTITETCVSREFGRSLQEKSEDPRSGTRTSTLQSISRMEPDPSLFQPPAGYTEQVQGNGSTAP